MSETPDDDSPVNLPTALTALVCVVAGVVLITQGHEEWGGMLLSFALGAATLKPLVRPDR